MPSAASSLTNGPIRLRAAIADELWLIALYTPEGENFYTVAGADMKRAQLDLILAAADQTVEGGRRCSGIVSDEVLVVNAPVTEGIALIRAPLAGPSRAPRAENALKDSLVRPLHQGGWRWLALFFPALRIAGAAMSRYARAYRSMRGDRSSPRER